MYVRRPPRPPCATLLLAARRESEGFRRHREVCLFDPGRRAREVGEGVSGCRFGKDMLDALEGELRYDA